MPGARAADQAAGPLAIALTGPAPAAIAVVRLCGRGAVAAFLAGHFSRPAVAGKAIHGLLRDGDRIVDDAMVVLHEDGECADLNLHGGPWVVRQALELASRSGFGIAHAGQSLADASLEGVDGATLAEREAMAAMPLASTWLGVRMLAQQGRAWRRRRHCLGLIRALRDPALRRLLHPPTLAILGPPNVGKSTLANRLFAQERSITADLPGTTRDWVGDIAVLRRLSVMLIDTPGLRESADPLELRGIDNSREQIHGADLRLLVMEAASPDGAMSRQFPDALVVLNKADLPPATSAIAIPGAIPTVATRGEGIVALRQAIERRLLRPWRHASALGVWLERQKAEIADRLDGRVNSAASAGRTIHLATPGSR